MVILLAGLIIGACLVGLVVWLRNRQIATKWYDWLIGIIGLALLLFTIQNMEGSLVEGYATAALMFFVVTGILSLVLMAVPVFSVWRRSRAA